MTLQRISTVIVALSLTAGVALAQAAPGAPIPVPAAPGAPVPLVPLGGMLPKAPATQPAPVVVANLPAPVDPATVLAGLTAAVKAGAFDAAVKQPALDALAAGKDPALQGEAVANALTILYPDFKKAMALMGDEDLAKATPILQALTKNADPYLGANASFYLARAYMGDERYEEAIALLDRVADKDLNKTTYGGEATFLMGVCQARLIQRQPAMATLRHFVKNYYATAPERVTTGALYLLDQLEKLGDVTMGDVQDRMDDVRRLLKLEKTDKGTQTEEDKIIAILDQLIKKAEEDEKKGSGGGSGGGPPGEGDGPGSPGGTTGGKRPHGGAAQSTAPPGAVQIRDLTDPKRYDKNNDWKGDANKERARQAVLDAIKAKFPERYKELAEQYFKSLAGGAEEGK